MREVDLSEKAIRDQLRERQTVQDKEPRTELTVPTYAEFLERTRRVFRLTRKPRVDGNYARGLETKREDFA